MADLTRRYVLKRHRHLPVSEQPAWYLLDPTAEDVQRLREELAIPTGAAPDGSSVPRVQTERLNDFPLRQAARYVRRVERLQDPDGREISLSGLDEDGRLAVFRTLPFRVAVELSTATSDLDKEEERFSSGSALP